MYKSYLNQRQASKQSNSKSRCLKPLNLVDFQGLKKWKWEWGNFGAKSHLKQVYNINLNLLKLVLRRKLHRIKIWPLNTQFTLEMALAFTLVTHFPHLLSPSFPTSPKWHFKLGLTHFRLPFTLTPNLASLTLKISHFSTYNIVILTFNPKLTVPFISTSFPSAISAHKHYKASS